MAIRLTGLSSGLDTESMVKELTATYNTKKDDMWKEQKKIEYKQEAWTDLNADIYGFFKDTLFNAKLKTTYSNSELSSSNEKVATVTGQSSGLQNLIVKQIATQTHITGGKFANEPIGFKGSITVQIGGEDKQIDLTADMTGTQVAKKLSEVGLEANFDKVNGRLFLSSKKSGLNSDFSIRGDADVLAAIGLDTEHSIKLQGQNAEINLNGADFTFETNNFEINKIEYNLQGVGDAVISKKTNNQIYDTIKNFIEKYNEIIKKVDEKYNADNCTLDPLTDEERYVISDKQADDWDNKIKESILRRDETLGSLSSLLKNTMNEIVTINGEKKSIYFLGIKTGNYLTTKQADRGVLNIDDETLNQAIAQDEEGVVNLITTIAGKLYDKLNVKMKTNSMKSAYTVYNDKQLKQQYNDYTKKLDQWTEKVTAIEDKYYKQFAKMESMMATMQAQQSYLNGLFGF